MAGAGRSGDRYRRAPAARRHDAVAQAAQVADQRWPRAVGDAPPAPRRGRRPDRARLPALAGRGPGPLRQRRRGPADDRGLHLGGRRAAVVLRPVGRSRRDRAPGRGGRAQAQLALLRALPRPRLHGGLRRLLQAAQRGVDGDARMERGRAARAPLRGVRARRGPRAHRGADRRAGGGRRHRRLRQPLRDQGRRLALDRMELDGHRRGGADLRLGARRHPAQGDRGGPGAQRSPDAPDRRDGARRLHLDRRAWRDHRLELPGGDAASAGRGARRSVASWPRRSSPRAIARRIGAASSASSPPARVPCWGDGSS